MIPPPTLIDGAASPGLPWDDRAFMYGDGLFETIAGRDGRPCLWAAHFARLRQGAARLSLPLPAESLLLSECLQVADSRNRCVVRLVLTRGSGGRGYAPPADARPRRVLSRYPWPDYPPHWAEEGIRAGICRTRLAEQPLLARIKHLNRLEQVLARSEWDDPGRAEGLMCDRRGRVVAGTMSNLFVLGKTGLATPRLDTCGVEGTVRGLVLRSAPRFGLRVVERDLRMADVLTADGVLLTNALIGVWAVRLLGGRRYDLRRLPREFLDWIRVAVHRPDPEV
jgi:4-amino-4-deoxychorismate lyase